ncbi:MAG: chaperonin, partial [Clostridia bacterium]|nr:chaperonin [Clostridia bacterium]
MSLKNVTKNTEVEEKLTALDTNVAAVQAIARAVEGTIGPKGLDTMLVDRFGEVVITNDGVTILNLMEVNHPAAKMLINAARSQEEEIGDGTTTATILASALVTSGAERVKRGVPVARIVEGLSIGVRRAVEFWEQNCWPVVDLEDSILRQVALVAGRGYEDISELVIRAARLVGKSVLLDPSFRLRDCVCAAIGAENDVFSGVVINKQRMNEEMPEEISSAKIVIIDDALEPEELEDGALGTEAGFARFLDLRREFEANLSRLISCGVNVVLVDRGVSEIAEEILTEAGVMVVQRVSRKQIRKVAEHTGAKPIKRTGLKKSAEALERCLGRAERVVSDEKLEQVR